MTPNNQLTDQLDQADKLLERGQYPEAIHILENILTKHPEEEPVLLRLAWAHWDAGNKESSIRYWETLLDYELQHKVFTGFAYDELVRIYKQEGLIDRLMSICEQVVRIQPDDVGLLTEMGSTYLLAGEFEKACETFRKLTQMEEDNPAFACRLGEAHLAAGRPDACLEAFEQAVQIDPDEAHRYFYLAADLFIKKNDAANARQLLDRCLKIAPSNSLYACSMGDVLVALGQIEDAFASYEKACRSNDSHAAAYFNRLGNTLMKAELFEPAIRAFETALLHDPSLPCRRNLEKAYQASGRSPV